MKLTIGEIFKQIENAKNDEEKIVLLKKSSHPVVKEFCRLATSPTVKWLIPDELPYKFNKTSIPDGFGDTNLWMEARRFYIYVESGRDKITQKRREQLWMDFVERLDTTEAQLCLKMAKQAVPGLTYEVVCEVYPDLTVMKTTYVPVNVLPSEQVTESIPTGKKKGRGPWTDEQRAKAKATREANKLKKSSKKSS